MIPFLGIGTGRSGTNSLTQILNASKGVSVTKCWEVPHWYGLGSEKLVDKLLDSYAEKEKLIGDVSEYHLPHLKWYRERIGEDLKIVCLHRPKDETVDSMMRTTARLHRPNDLIRNNLNAAGAYYPVIDAATERQAFEFFWEFYEVEAASITGNVHHISTESLNDNEEVGRLLKFLGVSTENRVYPKKRKYDPHDQKRELTDAGIHVNFAH